MNMGGDRPDALEVRRGGFREKSDTSFQARGLARMKEVFIGSENLLKLIGRWAKDHRVYVPVKFDIMNNEETPDYDLVKEAVPETFELHGRPPPIRPSRSSSTRARSWPTTRAAIPRPT